MRFQTDKESREKTMNKILRQIKQEVKNIPNNDPNNMLSQACLKSSTILYEYLLKSIEPETDDLEEN